MANFTVVYDACVLYPAPLRDLLVELARTGLFRAHWTAEIHQEWMRNVLNDRPNASPEKLTRTRQLMDSAVLDALVTGYESLIVSLNLPDPDDRHVLAAAIHCGANIIVTKNLKDFPTSELSKYNIEAQHPDTFIRLVLFENRDFMLKEGNSIYSAALKVQDEYSPGLSTKGDTQG